MVLCSDLEFADVLPFRLMPPQGFVSIAIIALMLGPSFMSISRVAAQPSSARKHPCTRATELQRVVILRKTTQRTRHGARVGYWGIGHMWRSGRAGTHGTSARQERPRDFFASMTFGHKRTKQPVKAFARSWTGWKRVWGFCWRGVGKLGSGERIIIQVGRAPRP